MNDSPTPAYSKGISGRSLTIVVIVSLSAILLVGFWCVRTYDELSEARQATDVAWRIVATALDIRYRSLERLVARGVDSRQIDMRWGERWRSALNHFRSSSLPEAQRIAASEVEDLISRLPSQVAADGDSEVQTELIWKALSSTSELDQALSKHRVACEQERSLVSAAGGRLLDVMLVLRQPQELALARQ